MDYKNEWEDDCLQDLPDDFDEPDDDEPVYLPCPNCGEDVYEELEQCPHCGEYITHSTSPWQGKSPLWIVLGIAGIVAVIYVFVFAH